MAWGFTILPPTILTTTLVSTAILSRTTTKRKNPLGFSRGFGLVVSGVFYSDRDRISSNQEPLKNPNRNTQNNRMVIVGSPVAFGLVDQPIRYHAHGSQRMPFHHRTTHIVHIGFCAPFWQYIRPN